MRPFTDTVKAGIISACVAWIVWDYVYWSEKATNRYAPSLVQPRVSTQGVNEPFDHSDPELNPTTRNSDCRRCHDPAKHPSLRPSEVRPRHP